VFRVSVLLVAALLLTTVVRAQSERTGPATIYPDPALTPGEAFPGISAEQVCAPGYARLVRSVSATVRRAVFASYGLQPDGANYELDHFIPLELGGDNSTANLWPEPFGVPGAHEKDLVENYLHDAVCAGAMAIVDAENAIADDWYAVWLALQGEGSLPGPHIWYASTSPLATAYYCDDDPFWQTLNHLFLRAFASPTEILALYPGRHLHQPCLDGDTGG
jgi:hypothetical protein